MAHGSHLVHHHSSLPPAFRYSFPSSGSFSCLLYCFTNSNNLFFCLLFIISTFPSHLTVISLYSILPYSVNVTNYSHVALYVVPFWMMLHLCSLYTYLFCSTSSTNTFLYSNHYNIYCVPFFFLFFTFTSLEKLILPVFWNYPLVPI